MIEPQNRKGLFRIDSVTQSLHRLCHSEFMARDAILTRSVCYCDPIQHRMGQAVLFQTIAVWVMLLLSWSDSLLQRRPRRAETSY